MPLNLSDIQAATKAIEKAQRLLFIPHANVDPDGLSSALACYSVFRSLGKECTVICPDTLPESLKFLPNYEHLSQSIKSEQQFVITLDCSNGMEVDKLRYTVEDDTVNIIVVPKNGVIKKEQISFHEIGPSYDLIVVLDTADLALLGSFYTDNIDVFTQIPVLNVDHHISNTRFGQLQLIDPTAASATEVLYGWFSSHADWKKLLTPDIATLLLTGLITDTRSFQNPNTTPKSLEVAANLIDLGARQQEIIQHLYKTKPLSTLKIWGRALNHIQMDPDARIVWSSVSREDLQEMGSSSKETAGLLDELISTIPDADVHIMFTEVEEGGFKASMRSSNVIDVSRAAGRLFGGGGHARASGFKMKGYGNFNLQVMECILRLKEEMHRQRLEGDKVQPVDVHDMVPQKTHTVEQKSLPQVEKSPPNVDIVQQMGGGIPAKSAPTDIVQELRKEF